MKENKFKVYKFLTMDVSDIQFCLHIRLCRITTSDMFPWWSIMSLMNIIPLLIQFSIISDFPGLKMIDIDQYLNSIQISWLKRLTTSTPMISSWKIIPLSYFETFWPDFLIFKTNMDNFNCLCKVIYHGFKPLDILFRNYTDWSYIGYVWKE
jgi:hypothetical protein